MKNNPLSNVFQTISEIINGAEKSFLDLMSAIVPYFVPLIPAYLMYNHAMKEMGFPGWIAITAAFVVEVLGLTSVATAIRFQRHNTLYKDAKNKSPFGLAIATYIFYLAVVLSVNVLLEVKAGTRSGPVIWAIGLFSLLSLPSAVLISIRSQYAEILEERQAAKEERRQARTPMRPVFAKDTKLAELEERPTPATFRKP